jgi:lytic murein transglycosylase
MISVRVLICAAVLAAVPSMSIAKTCGGGFNDWMAKLKSEAVSKGHSKSQVNKFFRSARLDPKVIKADNSQGVFRLTFTEFASRAISTNRMNNGKKNMQKYKNTFAKAQKTYGVQPEVLTAFWGLETDFGAVQGNFNTLNALITLSHDCRRPELFRPQIFAALKLWERGDFDPVKTTGAWAGEIGMVQMLPEDILNRGVDGDGDGRVRLKTSPPDALMTGARLLKDLGWAANQPWLVEVTVPKKLNWVDTGLDKTRSTSEWVNKGVKARSGKLPKGNLQASLMLPQGRKGPAFLAMPNFHVYFEWNKSLVYVTTAAYLATRLAGATPFNKGKPDPAFSASAMKSLQKKLKAHGHDVGKVDGILGAKTRAAVQKEQMRLGYPADAWPTVAFAKKL